MKTYVCNKIENTININDEENISACPNCGFLDEYNMSDSMLADNEIDAIIDSIIEDVFEEKDNKIINRDETEKHLIISDSNKIVNSSKGKNLGDNDEKTDDDSGGVRAVRRRDGAKWK